MKKEHIRSNDGIDYVRVRSGTCYHTETPDQVISCLEALRESRDTVRIFYGDVKTGQSWHDSYEVVGRIGRSTGEIKIPLLVPKGEPGGPSLLDHCIIRIDTRDATLYQHDNFRVGDMTLLLQDGWWTVMIDAMELARFTSNSKAVRFMAFLHGHVFEESEIL